LLILALLVGLACELLQLAIALGIEVALVCGTVMPRSRCHWKLQQRIDQFLVLLVGLDAELLAQCLTRASVSKYAWHDAAKCENGLVVEVEVPAGEVV